MRLRLTLLIAAGVAALALAAPAAAPASSSQFTIFEAPREMASFNASLRQRTLDEIQSFGVTHMRVLVYWNSAVRDNNAKRKPKNLDETDSDSAGYDFSRYDAIFAEAAQRGIEVIPTITGPVPRWATGRHRGHVYKPDRDQFERFVEAVGSRYGSMVSTWTIWNEPNQPQFLAPQFVKRKPYSPKLYRALYQAALQGLGATRNGGDTILAGETSPSGASSAIVAPITFARVFFKGKRLRVDGWAHHPYTRKQGPFYKPEKRRNGVTIGVLGRLTKTLDRYSKHRRLPLYLTEFGIQSKPDPFYGVSQSRQAEYRSISEKIAYDNPRVRAISQYLMRDDKPRKGAGRLERYGGFESGLRFAGGRKKQSYEGFRLPLVATRKSRRTIKLWGLARPADGATKVTLEYRGRKGGWKRLAEVTTNRRGYFKRRTSNRKGRRYRVKFNGFTGPATRSYRAP